MTHKQRSWLGLLAATGIILFLVINWGPSVFMQTEDKMITETRPAITKEAAIQAAGDHIRQLGGGEPLRASVVYQSNKMLSGYVQKEHLVEAYLSRFAEQVPIDTYQVELHTSVGLMYLVDVDLERGAVIGWQRRSEGTAPTFREGRAIAEAYLASIGKPLGSYESLRPNSTDPYEFAFQHRRDKLGEALLREVVDIRDGQVTAYRTELRVPNSHYAWVERQDNAASGMTMLSMIASAIMGAAAAVIVLTCRKRIAFVRGVWLTLVFVMLYWIHNFNMLPAFKTLGGAGNDPFMVAETAIGMVLVMNVIVAIMGVIGYLSLAAGQPLWQSSGLRLWPRWGDADFGTHTLISVKRGYLLAMLMLGLQSLMFYIAEQRFDMWSVTDPSGSMYNLLVPQLFPLMAWTAAISEEAIYRFFGIALFRKLLRSTFLAVLVPSIIWAWSHTQYPIYPVYTRMIEVTLLGIVFGYAFLKYGFATALFAHAAMDSVLMSFGLMNLGGAGNIALALFYMAMPALVGWLLARAHRLTGRFRAKPSG